MLLITRTNGAPTLQGALLLAKQKCNDSLSVARDLLLAKQKCNDSRSVAGALLLAKHVIHVINLIMKIIITYYSVLLLRNYIL